MAILAHLRSCWRSLVLIISVVCLSPLIFPGSSSESRCGFCLLLMATLWITEALPLPVTSLFPVVLMPLLGISRSKEVSVFYMKNINFLLMGGLLVAIAIEECNLHKRFALRLLLLLGVQLRRLMLGFMLATGIMSMWISNTAATAMMLPVAKAVFLRLNAIRKSARVAQLDHDARNVDDNFRGEDEATHPIQLLGENKRSDEDAYGEMDNEAENILKGLCLCVCYSANCGGVGTLTGSPPQLVLKGQVDRIDGNSGTITYTSYMMFALPVSLVCLLVMWVLLQIVLFGFRKTFSCQQSSDKHMEEEIMRNIRQDYDDMGPMSFAEKVVLGHFLVLVALWLTRNPGIFPGWSVFFKHGYVSDSVPAMLVAVSLFCFPNERPNILCFKKNMGSNGQGYPRSILQWSPVCSKFPWGVLILLGGGFALADGFEKSGLSRSVADSLVFVQSLSPMVAGMVITVIAGAATEIGSNTVVTSLFLPIIVQIARTTAVNPLYFMIPATVATSCAFMLPVATPPNAIVYSSGNIRITEMVKAGIVIKIATLGVIILAINTWGVTCFNLDVVPDWFDVDLGTTAAKNVSSNATMSMTPFV